MLAFWVGIEKTVGMRGAPDPQLAMLTTLSTEELIPPDHPIRRIRAVVDVVLGELDDVFDGMYAAGGEDVPSSVELGWRPRCDQAASSSSWQAGVTVPAV